MLNFFLVFVITKDPKTTPNLEDLQFLRGSLTNIIEDSANIKDRLGSYSIGWLFLKAQI